MATYDNIATLFLDVLSQFAVGSTFSDMASQASRLKTDLKDFFHSDIKYLWEGVTEGYQASNFALMDVIGYALEFASLIVGLGNARAWDDLEIIRQGEAMKTRPNLPPSDWLRTALTNRVISSEDLTGTWPKMGFDDKWWPAFMSTAGYTMSLDQWVKAYQVYYERLPTVDEFNERWLSAIDDPEFLLSSYEQIPPLDMSARYIMRAYAATELAGNVASWQDIGPTEYGPNTLELIQTLAKRFGFDESYGAMFMDTVAAYPDAGMIVRAGDMWDIPEDQINQYLIQAGYHPSMTWMLRDMARYVVNPMDLIRVSWRFDNDDETITKNLRRIGTHPNSIPFVIEASRYYPTVQDLIVMAVREVFTPEIASQYGQFEDFPTEFVTAAKRAGLSEEWAKNYWAAHWSLPSPTQGYEMLHRGIIDENQLSQLLRSLDIMPYWRDKLMDISYNVPGRIDVRRMYAAGVYDLNQVYDNYLKLGYEPDAALALTEYTHNYTMESQTGFKPSDVYDAFIKGYIGQSEAKSILASLAINNDTIEAGLQRSLMARDTDLITQKIKLEQSYYVKGLHEQPITYGILVKLGLDDAYIKHLMEKWEVQRQAKVIGNNAKPAGSKVLTSTEVLAAWNKELLTESDCNSRLVRMGYSTDDADLLVSLYRKEKNGK